jgi:hypothetical protein
LVTVTATTAPVAWQALTASGLGQPKVKLTSGDAADTTAASLSSNLERTGSTPNASSVAARTAATSANTTSAVL